MSSNEKVQERVEALVEVLEKNKISYNKSIINVTSQAYDKEEYGIAAFRLVETLEKLTTYGINHGFKTIRNEIKMLSDEIVELGKINKETKYQKIIDETNKIVSKLGVIGVQNGVIKKPIIEMIKNTIEGIETIKNEKDYHDKVDCLNQVIENLNDYETRIKNLFDDYSATAYSYALKIFDSIQDLRYKIASGAISTLKFKEIYKHIDSLLVLWENQTSSSIKKAKIDPSYKFDNNLEDKFYIVTNSSMFFEDFNILEKETKNFYEKMINNDRMEELLENSRLVIAKLEDINNKALEYKTLYDAKKITKQEVAIRLQQLQNEKVFETDKQNSISKELNKLGASKYMFNKKIYDIGNEICSIVEENRNNKEFIYLLSKNFNLESVLSLFIGNPSSADVENIKESFKNAKIYAEENENNIKEIVRSINLLNADLEELSPINNSEDLTIKNVTLEEPSDSDIDELFKSFGLDETNENNNNENETNDNNVNIDNI